MATASACQSVSGLVLVVLMLYPACKWFAEVNTPPRGG
jgi:hypothetical protein